MFSPQKFIYRDFFPVAFLVMAMMVSYQVFMPDIPNDYSFKAAQLERKASEIQVLVLGNSHFYFGIDPSCFSLNTFNAAHVSQTYDLDYYIFKRYAPKMHSLKYVIIPLSSFSPWSRLNEGVEKWRYKEYVNYGMPSVSMTWKERMHPITKERLLQVASIAIGRKPSSIQVDSNGFCPKDEVSTEAALVADAKTASLRHTIRGASKDYTYNESLQYIKDITKILDDMGATLILVSPPAIKEYTMSLTTNMLNLTKSFAEESCGMGNVKFINMLSPPPAQGDVFEHDDFFNADHLNRRGAIKLSSLISDSIMAMESNR